MQTADLYMRVSTDEKALKGYSIRAQEELLRKYCDINNIRIRKVIYEDHSAKTFNRPAWKQYLKFLTGHRRVSVLLLFLRWDRFSRNTGDAYQMIKILGTLGVEPQAVDQPLDLSIPENKMMLAFYLAIPEVENDRRSMNVITGMRRAMKEGRFMGLAPIGYTNVTDLCGKKLIFPEHPQSGIIQWAFRAIANEELSSIEQVFKQAKSKGFAGTKSLFWFAIRNPVYCGRISIPRYADEDACVVKGVHQPLISESLFDKVQDVLDSKKPTRISAKGTIPLLMPLRGFLLCPICGKTLTGSSSKGRKDHYSYYHCFDGCRYRVKVEVVNKLFESELDRYSMRKQMLEVYKTVLSSAWQLRVSRIQAARNLLLDRIKDQEGHISYIRTLLLSRKIETSDFLSMKSECSIKIEHLEARLSMLASGEIRIQDFLSKAFNNSYCLKKLYRDGTIELKRRVIDALFPDKLVFDDGLIKPIRINEVLQLVRLLDGELKKQRVTPTRWKTVVQSFRLKASRNFLPDLRRLANLTVDNEAEEEFGF